MAARGRADASSLVRWQLHRAGAAGEETLLMLEHSRLDGEIAYSCGAGAGWHDLLDRLPPHLAGEQYLEQPARRVIAEYRELR